MMSRKRAQRCIPRADENGLTLIDMKDLRALLDAIAPDPGKKPADADEDPLAPIRKAAQGYGNVSKATIGTISRQLLVLENQGGAKFFGEPALTLKDFIKTDSDGRGMVNILVADKLMQSPRLYATFLLWMLSELFEELPEAGDLAKPNWCSSSTRHNLCSTMRRSADDKIEQVVRLIRSKAVGVLFVNAKSDRRARQDPRPARQTGCSMRCRLHAARPEGGGCRGADLSAQSKARHRPGHHGVPRRSVGVVPRRRRHAVDGRARHDPAAVARIGPIDHAGGTQGDHQCEPGEGQIRHRCRRRVGLRDAAEARRRHRSDRDHPDAGAEAAAFWDRSARWSERFSGPACRAAECRPVRSSRAA